MTLRILLISLERTRITLLNNAASRLSGNEYTFLFESIVESEIFRSSEEQIRRRFDECDVVILSHILNSDAVERLLPILKQRKETQTIVPISSDGRLMRLLQIGKLSFSLKDDSRTEAVPKEVSLVRKVLTKIFDEDDLVRHLKDLMVLAPKALKVFPGSAQGIRYYLELYIAWLEPTPANTESLLKILLRINGIDITYDPPQVAPSEGLYRTTAADHEQCIGLLIPRTSIISGETKYIDELIELFAEKNIGVIAAYTEAFDSRKCIETYFCESNNKPSIYALISLTGFPLVGGHIRSLPDDAVRLLRDMNVPYFTPITLTHQSLEEWKTSREGLTPIQTAVNMALPELDGAIEQMLLVHSDPSQGKQLIEETSRTFVERVTRRIALGIKANSDKKIAVVIYCFPPSRGAVGTAAYLDVSRSLLKLLRRLEQEGYTVEVPPSAESIISDLTASETSYASASSPLTAADTLSVLEYKKYVPDWKRGVADWGESPGELNTDGSAFLIQGKRYGNIFVGVQPGFGYEGDPMRLLFTKNASTHHGFRAFYAYIHHKWKADAIIHFGTHGALEFMPGKQNGLSAECYPHSLIGAAPNLYLYSMNNPSEATIAKRRSYATTVSYLAPTSERAGLYRDLQMLSDMLDEFVRIDPADDERSESLRALISEKAVQCHLQCTDDLTDLRMQLHEIAQRLIPLGLRIIGEPLPKEQLTDMFEEIASFERPERELQPLHSYCSDSPEITKRIIHTLIHKGKQQAQKLIEQHITVKTSRKHSMIYLDFLEQLLNNITASDEITPLIDVLAGKYIEPGPGGDILRIPRSLPVGRNITSLNPLAIPTPFAVKNAKQTTQLLLQRRRDDSGTYPESIGFVLWGLDNIKTGGEAIAQAFYLLGVEIRQDSLGNMSKVKLIPLEELGRPRIDCLFTVSGIFRDMFGHHIALLDEAVALAAHADEPVEMNFIRKHYQILCDEGVDEESALYRIFSNASGTYGTNVDYMVMSGSWQTRDDMADVFTRRKGYAFGKNRTEQRASPVLKKLAKFVDTTYQNLDSSEIGISDVDHYYEYLGGLTNLAASERGEKPAAYVADTTTARAKVRSLEETVALEARTKVLNPKWYEAMLKHGFEGVEEIRKRIDYNYGWSATADAAPEWFYDDVVDIYIRDAEMKHRMSELNPDSFQGIVSRLYEASERGLWNANEEQLRLLRDTFDGVVDQLEGITADQNG